MRVIPAQPPKVEPLPDVTGAVSLRDARKLPSTADQYKALRQEIDKSKPAAESAKRKSDQLNGEAADLRKRLADTTADPEAYARRVASMFLPDILPYRPATAASFGFAGINGRALG